MSASNTVNGKAFEFACLLVIRRQALAAGKEVVLNDAADQFRTAYNALKSLDPKTKERYMLAAKSGVKTIVGLEPRLLSGDSTLYLEIAADSAGANGDVRDVVCVRAHDYDGRWEIGLSCKHNHAALKHPRITEDMDFGTDWIGTRCSTEFFATMRQILQPLGKAGANRVEWSQIEDKFPAYYIPILEAYLNEIKRMCAADPGTPKKLLEYFFGRNDFYKVIMDEGRKTTQVEGFNMSGTLNRNYKQIRPVTSVPRITYPTRLIEAVRKSDTTINLTFDGGWAVSMRLHNKDRIAKPTSLAWDVNLIGLPPKIYVNTRGWGE